MDEQQAFGDAQKPYDVPGGGEFFEDYGTEPGLPAEAGRATPEDYSAALEELSAEQPRRRGMVIMVALIVILLIIAVAGGVIYMYKQFGTPQQGGEVPVITPPEKPIKTAPPKKDTGTMPVRRKQIYDRILTDGEEEQPARIKPSEEKPMTPPAPEAPPATGEGAEPLPLPLPPPPALDGGTGGMQLPPPPKDGETMRTATASQARGTGSVASGPARSDVDNASPISPAGTTAEEKGGQVAAVTAGGKTGSAPEEAASLPLPPVPPPVPPAPGVTGAEKTETASTSATGLDEKGLAALAARAGADAQPAETPPPKAQAGPSGGKAMTNGGTTAAQKRAVAAVSGPGKTTADTASAKAATDRKRKEAAARARRKALEEARRKKKMAARRTRPEPRLAVRERTARERGGPRSILPPAVSRRTSAVAFAERQPAPRPIVPAPQAPGGPRPIVPTPERKVKITNFNAGRAKATAPAGRGPKPVAPVTRRVAAITPAPRTTAPAPRPGTARGVRTGRSTPTPPQRGQAPGRGAGGYVVQLAAYRSQEDALRAYQRIRARHGGLLGGLSPVIQKKDLGAAGVFYRLAVGPLPSRDQARRLCNALIARGEKDCLVRKR